jgi:ABC-type amino acid transport substrate-binding protein
LKLIPCELPVLKGDEQLRDLLNAGIEDLLLSGQIDQLLDKWETPKGAYLRVAQPFSEAK